MTRQQQCSVCGKWYYNHNGMMIVLPDTYDDDKCPGCNRHIAEEIEKNEVSDYKEKL